MFSPDLLDLLCCPTDHAPLKTDATNLVCTRCGTIYPIRDGCAELLPRTEFEHTTQYAGEEGGVILDYRDISAPLLSAQIKNEWLNKFIQFEKGDVVLDLGCGNGKFAYWNRARVKTMLAADLAPWFADRARAELPLLRADLRCLPVADAVLDKLFSIDVLEHLTLPDIEQVLEQARRVIKPRGRFFVFSNTRERQTLAPLMAPQRAVTRWLASRGTIDFARDDWRKSDHVKAVSTYEELRNVFERHGFVIRRVKFWNGVFQGWTENVIVKLGESYLSRRARGNGSLERQINARSDVRAALNTDAGSRYEFPLEMLTRIMGLDLTLFGDLRAGPYFLLAEKE